MDQKGFFMKAYYKNGDSLTVACREFQRYYSLVRHDHVLSCNVVKTWIEYFVKTSWSSKKKLLFHEISKPQRILTLFGLRLQEAPDDLLVNISFGPQPNNYLTNNLAGGTILSIQKQICEISSEILQSTIQNLRVRFEKCF